MNTPASSITRAIADLLGSTPSPEASVAERVAFFEHKAAVFDRIADEYPRSAIEARELADNARARVRDLEGGA